MLINKMLKTYHLLNKLKGSPDFERLLGDMATKVSIEFYADAIDAFTKAIMD